MSHHLCTYQLVCVARLQRCVGDWAVAGAETVRRSRLHYRSELQYGLA